MIKNKTFIFSILVFIIFSLTLLSGCSQKNSDQISQELPESETVEEFEQSYENNREESYTYKHVIIVGVDGAGAYFKDAAMPRLNEIMENGAVTYTCITSKPSISAQCWGSLLTGTIPEIHGFTNNVVSYMTNPIDSETPTIFRILHEHMPDAGMASFSHWNAINVGIIEDEIGCYKATAGSDEEITDAAASYIIENKPSLVFIQFDEIDEAGHKMGFGTAEQIKEIERIDNYIGRLYDAYVDAGIIDDTLFIVTADHGGCGTSHGGWTDGEKNIMFAATGRTVAKKGIIEDMGIRDTAAIVLYAFGLDDYLPDCSTARVPSGLFEGVTATERKPELVQTEFSYRIHESEQTPEFGSGKSVVDVIGVDRVAGYFPFDNDISDMSGKIETTFNGKLYFPEAYFGNGIRFDDGYVILNDFQPDMNNFSIGFWMNLPDVNGDPPLIANKGFRSKANPGFAVAFRYDSIWFNVGNKKTEMTLRAGLPATVNDGWTYVLIVVDRENSQVGFSFDFGKIKYIPIDEDFKDLSFSTNKSTVIGRDASGTYPDIPQGTYDEFIFVNDLLNEEDIEALKTCYVH